MAAAACMLSHSVATDLDNIAGNMDTERLVITPATDTTNAVMEKRHGAAYARTGGF
ncbi:Baseplate assembly protein J [Salmonella bongori N268-08]|uniref:Baseplate assembly protein J n=1 Tax=Salmonella bongori N268-08 TaxID=1197719 RepID=S5MPB3_SALBN|nr:Baseplate assembly protein J [Salmonella bongori N268-08]